MTNILDFSSRQKRYSGHDFSLCRKLDEEGYKWLVSIHHPLKPQINDFILMALYYDDVRVAIIEKVEACGNPHDMYFIDINIKNAKEKFIKNKL